jgi:hypothetical protein
VFAHRQLTGSVCPGPALEDWVRSYRAGRDGALARAPEAPASRASSLRGAGAVH